MDGPAMADIERPRSSTELIGATFDLYRRFPFLFLILAATVVVPYELIVLAITGTGPVTARSLTFLESNALLIIGLTLVGPLISALHVHAVDDVGRGERPVLASVARRSLGALPVVTAAVLLSALGIAVGLVALVVPGVLLALRWAVTAQVAALEDGGPIDALKRSAELARGNWEHIFGVLFLAGIIEGLPGVAIALAFRHTGTTVVSFLAGTAWAVLSRSFTALLTAVLYFDLRSRLQFVGEQRIVTIGAHPTATPGSPSVQPTGHPLDPGSYNDVERPQGWYVDPRQPERMKYWSGHDRLGWTPGTERTPKKTLADWEAHQATHPGPPPTPPAPPDRPVVQPTGHPLDPDSYTDAERPHGWYVIPETPWKMRHWSGGDPSTGWSAKTTKTPKQALETWWKVSDR